MYYFCVCTSNRRHHVLSIWNLNRLHPDYFWLPDSSGTWITTVHSKPQKVITILIFFVSETFGAIGAASPRPSATRCHPVLLGATVAAVAVMAPQLRPDHLQARARTRVWARVLKSRHIFLFPCLNPWCFKMPTSPVQEIVPQLLLKWELVHQGKYANTG